MPTDMYLYSLLLGAHLYLCFYLYLCMYLSRLPLGAGRQVLLSSSPPCDICKKISCEIRLELLNELFALMEMIIMSKYANGDNDEDDIMISTVTYQCRV